MWDGLNILYMVLHKKNVCNYFYGGVNHPQNAIITTVIWLLQNSKLDPPLTVVASTDHVIVFCCATY